MCSGCKQEAWDPLAQVCSRQDQLYPLKAELTALIAEWVGRAVLWRCFSSHWFAIFSLLQLWKWLNWELVKLDLGQCAPFSSPAVCQMQFHSTVASIQATFSKMPLLLLSCNMLYAVSFYNCFHSGCVLVCAHPKIIWSFLPWPHKWDFSKSLLPIYCCHLLLICGRVYKEEGSSLIYSKDKWIWVVKRFNIAPSQITSLTAAVGLFLAASLDHVMACVSSAHRLFSLLPGFFRVQLRGSALQLPPYHTTAQQPLATSLIPALPGKEQWVVMILQ